MTKTVLITGASRGLGAAMARQLAATHHIIAVAKTTGALEELDDAIQSAGGQATLAPMDITVDAAMQQLCRSIFDRWGKLDLWIHTAVTTTVDRFSQTPFGWIPTAHLSPVSSRPADPVAVAEHLLGTPYLWGGNSRDGIDCSGLVQLACWICGFDCPADSDLQAASDADSHARTVSSRRRPQPIGKRS